MTKILSTLLIGAALFGVTPALADNSADIVQEGGGINTFTGTQKGRSNDLGLFQDGAVNRADVKQRGRRNHVEGGQFGPDNDFILDQRSRRRR
jgi:hypothetical protein